MRERCRGSRGNKDRGKGEIKNEKDNIRISVSRRRRI